jgi:hypothetical protein
MILTKKHLDILEKVYDKKLESIDSIEVLSNDDDLVYYVQLVQMGLLREDEDHFFLTYPGTMLIEAFKEAKNNNLMPDLSSLEGSFRFVGSDIISMLYTAELAKNKVTNAMQPILEKRGLAVDGVISFFGKKVLEVYEELDLDFTINKPLQEFLKKTPVGPAPKRDLLAADNEQILEAEALRLLAYTANGGAYYNLTGVGQQLKAALLKGAFFKPITPAYFEAIFSIIEGQEIDENLRLDLVAQAVIDDKGEILPSGLHLLRAADLYFNGFYDDAMSIDIDELEFSLLQVIKEINKKTESNPEYLATKKNIKSELITKKFKEVQELKEKYGRRLNELPLVKQKYVNELENLKSEEEWFSKVYDFDSALFGMQGFQLIEPEINDDGQMFYVLTSDGKKVINLLKENPREISAESVKAVTIGRHMLLSPDGRWIEKAIKAKTIVNEPTPTGKFFAKLAYNNKTPNLTKYGLKIMEQIPYTTGMYVDDLLDLVKDYSREELIQLIEKLDARGMVNMYPSNLVVLTEPGKLVKRATSGLAGHFKYPVTPDIINTLRALKEVGSLYVKERKVRILPENWKKALKLLKMDLDTFEDTLTLLRKARYSSKDQITENGLLLIEAAEMLEELDDSWTETDF